MRTLVRAAGFLFLPALSIWPCELQIAVVDPVGRPLAGAVVSIRPSGSFATPQTSLGLTGSAGELRREVVCGSYSVSVRHPSFAEAQRSVVLRQGAASVPESFTLSLIPQQELVTVSAELGAVSVDEVAQRVSVVSAAGVRERTRTVLTEVAQGVLGVQEQRTAPAMGAFFVRGLTGKNVAIYKDGVRYSTALQRGGVSTFQNLIDPSALESVEFVRGPNSAQFGSDSLGGAVHLLSADRPAGAGFGGEVAPVYDAASASFGTSVRMGSQMGPFSWTSSLAGRRVNTVRPARGEDAHSAVTRFLGLPLSAVGLERLPDTGFTQYGGSIHAAYRMGNRQSWLLHYERNQQDGAKRYDQLLGGDGNLIADLRNLMVDFGYLRFQRLQLGAIEQVAAAVSFQAQREERVNQGGRGNPAGSINHQFERSEAWGTNVQASLKPWPQRGTQHMVAFGAEAYSETARAPAFNVRPADGRVTLVRGRVPDGLTYRSYGLYIQDAWRVGSRLRLTGALRFGGATYQSQKIRPTDSLTANAITGRLGGVFRPFEPFAIHASYSRGFRVPNATDLGGLGLQGNGAFEVNPNDLAGRGATLGDRADGLAQDTGRPIARLRPETSDNLEAGVSIRWGRFRTEATAFRTLLGNSIVSQTLILPPGAVGLTLGDQMVSRQLPSGAVFVPVSVRPVLVRANYTGARMTGMEHSAKLGVTARISVHSNFWWVHARDERTGRPPDLEPGIPPPTWSPSLQVTAGRVWVEPYATVAVEQDRLSSLALADRRIGATRSRSDIASFFNNGARVRGLVAEGRLVPTGETLAQVQQRVLGSEESAPLFRSIPGYGLLGIRLGWTWRETEDIFFDVSNLTDAVHRGIGWGVPGTGRSITVKYRKRF